MNKGGRVMQLYGIEHESFDLDLVLIPKSVLINKSMNNTGVLTSYDIKKTKELSENILELIKWFCENDTYPDLLSKQTPEHEEQTNKSIFKLSYKKWAGNKLFFIPLVDLAYTWKLGEVNHSNTLKYFIRPIHETYNVRGLFSSNIQLLFLYQDKEDYIREKEYIQAKETNKLEQLKTIREESKGTLPKNKKKELNSNIVFTDSTLSKISLQLEKLKLR